MDPSQAPTDLDLSPLTRDPDDAHVCALAIAGGADLLLTFDRGYLSEPLLHHGVEVPDLDEFLVAQSQGQPEAFRRTIEAQAAVWGEGRSVPELLAAFERANIPRFAEAIERFWA